MQHVLDAVRTFDGLCELAPQAGSEFPQVAWGDHFFYYAPDGQIPQNVQPYATVVTKDYPDDADSDLDPPGRWRVNIHVGATKFVELTGEEPRSSVEHDFSAADVVMPHPVYRRLGWVAVVNPAERSLSTVVGLLRGAHDDARKRSMRRQGKTR